MAVYLLVVGGTPPGSGLTETGSGLAVDFAATGKKAVTQNIGDGVSTSIAVTHNLGTRSVNVSCFRNSTPWDEVYGLSFERTSTNVVTFTFAVAPTSAQYTVVIKD